ncbi:MAG: nitroreductase family protein [Candidatus Woesearchaeota archaeon]
MGLKALNEFTRILKQRRSYRSYAKKSIPKEILEELVDCGRLAPSANNVQPWEFIVVTETDKLIKISEITDYGKFIRDSAACIVVVCKDTKYYLEDGCAATENILLAAESFGIGSCWVAGDKKQYCSKIMNLLQIPEGYKIVSIISLGYYTEKISPHDKRELEEVLHWNKF